MPRWAEHSAVTISDTFSDDMQDDMSDRVSHTDGRGRLNGDDATSRDHNIHLAVLSGMLELRRNICTEMVKLELLLGTCVCGAQVPSEMDGIGSATIHFHSQGSSWAARGADQRSMCSSEDSTIAAVHRALDAETADRGWRAEDAQEEGKQEVFKSESFVEHSNSNSAKSNSWKNLQATLRTGSRELHRIDTRLTSGFHEELTRLQKFTRSSHFEMFFFVMIMTNAVLMAVHVEYNTNHVGATTEPLGLKCATHFYNIVFLLELVLRLAAEGCRGFYCKKSNLAWAVLDTMVVAVSVVHLASDVYAAVDSLAAENNHLAATNLRVLRIVRMAKIIRTIRAFKLIRFMSALQTLLFSILVTLKALAWASVLMFVVIYVFALTFAQCSADGLAELKADGLPLGDHPLTYYWGSLRGCMLTLFQAMSNGLDWRPAYEALAETSLLCGVMFNVFVGFAYFVLLNVITGVFCNSAIESARKNPELIAHSLMSNRRNYLRNLAKLFDVIDADNSGTITMSEFEELLQSDMAHAHFQALELNVSDAWTLFKLIDRDGSGAISISEFLTGCEALKGGARTIDIASISYETKAAHKKLFARIGRMESILMGLYPEAWRPALPEALPPKPA